VGLVVNVGYARRELRAWWASQPPMRQKAGLCFLFPTLALLFWPILILLVVAASALPSDSLPKDPHE
jgi:hypothetical protein